MPNEINSGLTTNSGSILRLDQHGDISIVRIVGHEHHLIANLSQGSGAFDRDMQFIVAGEGGATHFHQLDGHVRIFADGLLDRRKAPSVIDDGQSQQAVGSLGDPAEFCRPGVDQYVGIDEGLDRNLNLRKRSAGRR